MSFFILVVVLLREVFLIGTPQEGKEESTRKQTPSFMNRIQRNQLLGTLKNRAAMITGTLRLVDLNSNSGIKHGGHLGDLGMHTGKPKQPNATSQLILEALGVQIGNLKKLQEDVQQTVDGLVRV
jgi:hypothetical protein